MNLFSIVILIIPVFFLCFCGKKKNDSSNNNNDEKETSYLSCQWTKGDTSEVGCVVRTNKGEKINEISEWKLWAVWQGNTEEILETTAALPDSEWQILFKPPDRFNKVNFLVSANLKIGQEDSDLTSCPVGYIRVPADGFYKKSEICIMKYEARANDDEIPIPEIISQPDQQPRRNIELINARQSCKNLGNNFRMMKNAEWMSIGVNIASLPENWSGNAVGSGFINSGISKSPTGQCIPSGEDKDPCFGLLNKKCLDNSQADFIFKRTHLLSNGEIIWDLSGNLAEILDEPLEFSMRRNKFSYHDLMYNDRCHELADFSENEVIPEEFIIPNSSNHAFWNDSWNSQNNLGLYYDSGGNFIIRGGGYLSSCKDDKETKDTAIFSIKFDGRALYKYQGFRCVYLLN